MEGITFVGTGPHVTSMQHRAILEMVIGGGSYILDKNELLEPELQSNNSLKIRSGMLVHHGGISEVKANTYDEVEINNGTQGMKRIDLIVLRYARNPETEVETLEWVNIQGTPAESNPTVPESISGDMRNGDLIDDCPFLEVHLEGIQVVEIKKLLPVLDGCLAELNNSLKTAKGQIAELNGNSTGYPNYSSRSKIIANANASYTIKKDGFVQVFAKAKANGTYAEYLRIRDSQAFNVCDMNALAGQEITSQFFPVKSGDIVKQFGVVNLSSDSGVWFIGKM